jgi:inner membrane protein
MTGRTHDLAAFTALNIAFLLYPPTTTLTLGTAATALGTNMLGGLLPDIDNATSDIWDKVRGGDILARFIRPLIGKHRMITHSILGMVIIGYLLQLILAVVGNVLLVDMTIVWWATMIGVVSHLVSDSITHDGVPWLFPIPIRFGFPPLRALRMKTGGFWEKVVVLPGLIALNGYLIYTNYSTYLHLLRGFYK